MAIGHGREKAFQIRIVNSLDINIKCLLQRKTRPVFLGSIQKRKKIKKQ
jgi:hypothetical protein